MPAVKPTAPVKPTAAVESAAASTQAGGIQGAGRKIIPGLAVSALALVALFYLVDRQQFVSALRQADYRFIALLFISTLVWLAARTMVWRSLLQKQASFSQVFFTLNEGYLINNLLPLRLGELARAFLLSRKASLKFMEVLSTIFVERLLDIAMAAGLLLASLALVVGGQWAEETALFIGGVVLVGLASLALAAQRQAWVMRQFERLSQRWPRLRTTGGRQLQAFLDGLAVFQDGRLFMVTLGWVIVNWTIALGQYYLILRAFFPQVQYHWVPFSLGVTTLGAAAPSSPAAIGVLEASMVGALSVFGLNPATALAAAVVMHLSSILVTTVLGSFALIQDGVSLTRLYRELPEMAAPVVLAAPVDLAAPAGSDSAGKPGGPEED